MNKHPTAKNTGGWQLELFSTVVDMSPRLANIWRQCYAPGELIYFGRFAIRSELVTSEFIRACFTLKDQIQRGEVTA